jgi:hypothetical protein
MLILQTTDLADGSAEPSRSRFRLARSIAADAKSVGSQTIDIPRARCRAARDEAAHGADTNGRVRQSGDVGADVSIRSL